MDADRENQSPPEEVIPDPGTAYIEQYKLYVQSADNNSARRVSINRYQTSLNIAVVALYGITETFAPQPVVQIIIALVGIILACAWLGALWSIRRLNKEKFKIIHSMEERLPRAVYYEEWQGLGEEKGLGYRSAHNFERIVPVIFAVLHAGAIIYFGFAPLQAALCPSWTG